MRILGLTLCLLWPLGGVLAADLEAVTTDGRKVILHSDRTWQYLDEISTGGEDLEKLLLSLRRVSSVGSTCNIVVRLQNSSTYPITSLVPQFSAYNEDDVVLLTVFEDFLSIKPTFHQDASISLPVGSPRLPTSRCMAGTNAPWTTWCAWLPKKVSV